MSKKVIYMTFLVFSVYLTGFAVSCILFLVPKIHHGWTYKNLIFLLKIGSEDVRMLSVQPNTLVKG